MEILYTDDNIEVCLEVCKEISSGPFIHISVRKFTVSKYKCILEVWNDLQDVLSDRGYSRVYAIPPTLHQEKFIKMFGFRNTSVFFDHKNVMVREL